MTQVEIKETDLFEQIEKLVKETEGQGVWSGWKIWLRFNPETKEFETTDFLSQGTYIQDNCIDIIGLESWSIKDNNEEWVEYIFDAYEDINDTTVDRKNTDAYDIITDEIEQLAYEMCDADYDYSELAEFNLETAKRNMQMNAENLDYIIEVI